MDYKQYKKARQDEFNALPIFWAFSDEQFEQALKERGLTLDDTDKITRVFLGGFCLKSDVQQIRDYYRKPDPLSDLMKDYDFARDAIRYEMGNHEYDYNLQADWDVCSCFGTVEYTEAPDELQRYFDELEWEPQTRRAYYDARRDYYKNMDM